MNQSTNQTSPNKIRLTISFCNDVEGQEAGH